MNETQKPPLSKLALASLLVALTGLCLYIPYSLFYFYDYPEFIEEIISLIIFLSIPSGVILGITANRHIKRNKSIVRGRIFSISALIIIAGIVFMTLPALGRMPDSVICKGHLHSIRNAFHIYAHDHQGKYPSADKWCDEIEKYLDFPAKRQFLCPAAIKHKERGPCHYAMNPNCEPNSPPDMVLLFESKGGWNRHGGMEFLTFDHHEGKYAFVLYNNGDVKLIKSEDIGKLRWKADEPKPQP
jgi:hypothetical protein